MSDINAALLARISEGDRDAWAEIVDQHAEAVWRATGNYGLDSSVRHDVTQTTWLRLFDHAARIREPERVRGWLCRVARNECLDVLRRRSRMAPLTVGYNTPEEAHDPIADLELDTDRDHRALREAWNQLTQACRELLSLCISEPPMSYDDIAVALDMPRGSVGPTRQRCLERMRRTSSVARLILQRSGESQ